MGIFFCPSSVVKSESQMKSHHSAEIHVETFCSVCGCNFVSLVSLQHWFVGKKAPSENNCRLPAVTVRLLSTITCADKDLAVKEGKFQLLIHKLK